MQLTHPTLSDPAWKLPLVGVLVLGLLAAFYAVVSDATKAAELRRKAMAGQSAALMRCYASAGSNGTKHCRKGQHTNNKTTTDAPVLLAVQ